MPAHYLKLFELLPLHLRTQDLALASPGAAAGPLEELLEAAAEQGRILHADIGRLYENFFVETCDPFLLPYLADLIALNLIAKDPAANRREVARTIAYRRRKGTVPQLETMARDITGFDCRVVEFFERLIWNQHYIHVKRGTLAMIDLRDRAALDRIGGAFDRSCHTADVRPSTGRAGWHNIKKTGFFLWRLRPIPLEKAPAAAVPAASLPAAALGGRAFHFNVLGIPAPLFASPPPLAREAGVDWPLAKETSIQGPLVSYLFAEEKDRYAQTPAGFEIFTSARTWAAADIVAADLCAWTEPPAGKIAVDPRLGRFLFSSTIAAAGRQNVRTNHYFGLSGFIGGGGYDRALTLSPRTGEDAAVQRVTGASGPNAIQTAINALAGSPEPVWVVQIDDSSTYSEPLTLPAAFDTLVIQAADGCRPAIVLDAANTAFAGAASGRRLVLRGLLITGQARELTFPTGIERIEIEDCTVDPGGGLAPDGVTARPAGVTLRVTGSGKNCRLTLNRSIAGPVKLPLLTDCLAVVDSILDGSSHPEGMILRDGPPVTLNRCTLVGGASCFRLDASEAIVTGTMTVKRRQEGCARFSYFGPASELPRRHKCVVGAPSPVFTSLRFGDPAYAQLRQDCPAAISRGGDEGREMGVWASLELPRRLDHLRLRLEEYLPAGLVPLYIFVT